MTGNLEKKSFVATVLLVSPEKPEEWPEDVQARVFTLEAPVPDGELPANLGVFCEWAPDGGHRNFGFMVPATRDEFVKAVAKVLVHNPPARAGFTPPSSSSLGSILLTAPRS